MVCLKNGWLNSPNPRNHMSTARSADRKLSQHTIIRQARRDKALAHNTFQKWGALFATI